MKTSSTMDKNFAIYDVSYTNNIRHLSNKDKILPTLTKPSPWMATKDPGETFSALEKKFSVLLTTFLELS